MTPDVGDSTTRAPSAAPAASDDLRSLLHEIRGRMDRTMLRDRHALRGMFRAVETLSRDNKPFDRKLSQLIDRLDYSNGHYAERARSVPKVSYPPELPISQKREQIAKLIRENQVVVLCGETGSGKTTQLPKICLELGRGVAGMIGHTQPRRIAARSVATRIAQEIGTPLGQLVGWKVRFADQVSENTLVKLLTDGMLLAEIQHDRFLESYDTIIIDEAHERSLNIDFLLGYLRTLLEKRPELKLIITSATIDPERFSRHFADAPIITVSGRTYPVEVRYHPLISEEEEAHDVELEDALRWAVDDIGRDTGGGDTLIFFPTERDIRDAAEVLAKHTQGRCEILPLFSRLSAEEQMRVFGHGDKRRLVLATNVAETSLTVPNIKGVIDTGTARISRYSAKSKVQRLPVESISQASADQRKGRCGRVAEGICVRLYSEADYTSRPQYTDPEILRTNLASVILQMKWLRLGSIEEFPFVDPPDIRQIRDGYATLHEIGALDENNELTAIGKVIAQLPIDPRISRMVLASKEHGCLDEMLVIGAALSIQDPRERPLEKQKEADESHGQFRDKTSDFITYLNLWNWVKRSQMELSGGKFRKECKARFLSFVRIREWQDVHRQLRELVANMGWEPNKQPALPEHIHKAVLPGLLSNVGTKGETFEYTGLRQRKFAIFPGSALFHSKPAWLVAAEVVETTRLYARTCAAVLPEWIEQAAKHLVRREYADAQWQRRTKRVMAFEKVTLEGLNIVPRRGVNFGPIDPVSSRQIFIKAALVDQDYDTDAQFFRHNAQLLREVELLEAKTRRRDILVDAASRYAFYDARVPAEVVDGITFELWRRRAEQKDRRVLFMSRDDLMSRQPDWQQLERFPAKLDVDGIAFPLDYKFDPSQPDDGVTATVRLAQLNQLPPSRAEWIVPGLIEAKVDALIRTLPKQLRVNLVPVPDWTKKALCAMQYGHGTLYEVLAATLGKLTGLRITKDDLKPADLEPYLHLNVRVLDEKGRQVAMGRDLDALRRQLRDLARDSFSKLPPTPWVRDNVKEWDFGDLPPRVELRHEGRTFVGYPGVVDVGDTCALRLLDTWDAALEETRRGVRRLFVIEYASALKYEVDTIPGLTQLVLQYASLGSGKQLRQQLADAIVDRLGLGDAPDIRTHMDFELRLESAWNKLPAATKDVTELTRKVLAQHHALRQRLEINLPPLLENSIDDVRRQLAALVPPDFLTATPYTWLPHLPRFLQAMDLRLSKLLNAGLQRDAKNLALLRPYLDELTKFRPHAESGDIDMHEYETFRWWIEELRVSLFAQELRTSVPVSTQRLGQLRDKLKADLDRL
jgi:ATP-dependent helicase HrpA